jgi:hypothetical protein
MYDVMTHVQTIMNNGLLKSNLTTIRISYVGTSNQLYEIRMHDSRLASNDITFIKFFHLAILALVNLDVHRTTSPETTFIKADQMWWSPHGPTSRIIKFVTSVIVKVKQSRYMPQRSLGGEEV